MGWIIRPTVGERQCDVSGLGCAGKLNRCRSPTYSLQSTAVPSQSVISAGCGPMQPFEMVDGWRLACLPPRPTFMVLVFSEPSFFAACPELRSTYIITW